MNFINYKNGDKMPAIGLGTWKSQPGEVGEAVKTALNYGYRHIDCAATYGNEAEIGEALAHVFSNNKIMREEVWITSKLWNNAHKKEDVIPALKKTLKDLQLDYLDLYLIHWPVAFKPGVDFPEKDSDYISLDEVPIIETWKEMQKAKELGLVKHIGVSNFSSKKLEDLINQADEAPEMNQVELHPYLQQPNLMEYCKRKNIFLTAYSPLGSSDRSPEMKADDEPSLLENETIKTIAEKRGASPAQVLIRWAELRGTAVIPKSTNKERIQQNFEAQHVKLEAEDLKKIEELDKHYRYLKSEAFETPGNPYQNIFDE